MDKIGADSGREEDDLLHAVAYILFYPLPWLRLLERHPDQAEVLKTITGRLKLL